MYSMVKYMLIMNGSLYLIPQHNKKKIILSPLSLEKKILSSWLKGYAKLYIIANTCNSTYLEDWGTRCLNLSEIQSSEKKKKNDSISHVDGDGGDKMDGLETVVYK